MSTRPPPLPSEVSAYIRTHPGRVERVDRVSGRGSPALAGSLPYPHHLREGKRTGKRTKRAGWQTGRCAALLLFAGRSVARCGDGFAQNWTGWPPFLSSWLLVRWWRSGERLAMVWTVRTADGTEERRGTGEDGGGILRPGPLSFFPSSCFCSSSIYNKVYIII